MTIGIHFGAMCDPIKDQLEKQGYTISEKDSERLQGIAKAITMLNLHGIIPDSVAHTSNQKLMKMIVKTLENQTET